jgi:chorismate synthase
VSEIGGIAANHTGLTPGEIFARAEVSPVRVADAGAETQIIALIDQCKQQGDTLGGVVEVVATGLPPGLGSFVQWDRKLDGRLAQALLSLQAVKGVEVGLGFATARLPGSQVHDEIDFDPQLGFLRRGNNSGGTEGGMSTGEPLWVRAAFKPLSTLMRPLHSVDINTKEAVEATIERSDVCAIPAAAVIAESVVAFVLAQAFLEKFGGDSLAETQRNYDGYMEQVRHF